MTLGKKVKALRRKLNLSQRELADRCGIRQATISRLEADKVHQLKSFALRNLAESLGVSIDHLMDKSERMNAEEVLRNDPGIQEFIALYSNLDAPNREQVKKWMRFLLESTKPQAA